MIRDSNSVTGVVETEVCIIGSGPAGLLMAMELGQAGRQVCLLESGGLEFEKETQDLYRGKSVGILPPQSLAVSRSRLFGGTSDRWAGLCGLLDDIDFKPRSWIGHSGWPITKDELLPHYRKAAQYLGLAENLLLGSGFSANPKLIEIDFDHEKLETGYVYKAPIKQLGIEYKKRIETSNNIDLILHSNLFDFKVTNECRSIKTAEVKSLSQKTFNVKAKVFVLACGGIENARLLLCSNSIVKAGLGNEYDLVGRFMMDHPLAPIASVYPIPGDDRALSYNAAELCKPENDNLFAFIKFPEKFQRENALLNSAVYLTSHEAEFGEGLMACSRIRAALLNGVWPKGLVSDVAKIIGDLPGVLPTVSRRKALPSFSAGLSRRKVYNPRLAVKIQAEQAPNPESRVLLTNERDALGLNRPKLKWIGSKIDHYTVDVLIRHLASEFERLNIAKIELDKWIEDGEKLLPDDLRGGVHHIGTTRMSEDPKNGVVDSNCRLHSISNLFIAGSSVFPTGGWVNPTFSICALALRLADHLNKSVLKK